MPATNTTAITSAITSILMAITSQTVEIILLIFSARFLAGIIRFRPGYLQPLIQIFPLRITGIPGKQFIMPLLLLSRRLMIMPVYYCREVILRQTGIAIFISCPVAVSLPVVTSLLNTTTLSESWFAANKK